MRVFDPPALLAELRTLLPVNAARLCVALSGGMDSVLLLHALASLRQELGLPLQAVHVDHHLQSASSQWAQWCLQAGARLGIVCSVLDIEVAVEERRALGVEAAARGARYAALKRWLQPGDVLLTAHHADDQLETLLLALLRGAGLKGLSAMPACVPFGAGWHARPLLPFTREDLALWAAEQALDWRDDPTNREVHFDRNFLRHEVLPRLRTRWPAAAVAAVRSAAHLGEAQHLLDETIATLFAEAQCGRALRVDVLRRQQPAQQRALLRHWLHAQQLRMPSTRVLNTLLRDMLDASADRIPCVRWGEVDVHRHRELLYAEASPRASLSTLTWQPAAPLPLPNGLGGLQWQPATSAAKTANRAIALRCLPEVLEVRWRSGGELLQPGPRQPRRELRKLLQEAAVLPWWRERIPLLYASDQLLAVGDLWVDAAVATQDDDALMLVWSQRPMLFAESCPPLQVG